MVLSSLVLIVSSFLEFLNLFITTHYTVILHTKPSILAIFMFGVLALFCGSFLIVKDTLWFVLIKIFAVGILSHLLFGLVFKNLDLISPWLAFAELFARLSIGLIAVKLTQYLIKMNKRNWGIESDPISLIIGVALGFLPFIFQLIFHYK